MENPNILSLLGELDDNIDDLDEALAPFIKSSLPDATGKLPLLDKAKLYVLITYALESMLFSHLRLNGVDAKRHAIFRELTRVKQYFEKIQSAENVEAKRENLVLDKSAAGRFIKHALSGNDKYDAKRAEQLASDKPRAYIRFEEISKDQPDNAAEAISTPVSRSSASSDSRDPTEFDGQRKGDPSIGLAQVKVTSELQDHGIFDGSNKSEKPQVMGKSGKKRRRTEESIERTQKQRKRKENKREPI